MTYFAIPLTNKKAILAKIYVLIPDRISEYPYDLDTIQEDTKWELTRQDYLKVRQTLNEHLFENEYHNPLSDYRFSEVIIGDLGIWIKLHNWKSSAIEMFNGWFVTEIRKVDEFGSLVVENVRIIKNEVGEKVIQFTVDGLEFEEVLATSGTLPSTRESHLQHNYPYIIISRIHEQLTLGSLVA